jgi:NADH-quinone oxidoreductase subunit N
LAFTLFSLAGIPPLSGFTAKLIVLQAYIGYNAIIAVLASVISAANYLHLIKISNLDLPLSPYPIAIPASISYLIAILSSFILLFTLKPTLLILSSKL